MSKAISIRLPEGLARWLDETARRTGKPKGRIIREALERSRAVELIAGPRDLSMRKGFSRLRKTSHHPPAN